MIRKRREESKNFEYITYYDYYLSSMLETLWTHPVTLTAKDRGQQSGFSWQRMSFDINDWYILLDAHKLQDFFISLPVERLKTIK